jgi:hypothetical protein
VDVGKLLEPDQKMDAILLGEPVPQFAPVLTGTAGQITDYANVKGCRGAD